MSYGGPIIEEPERGSILDGGILKGLALAPKSLWASAILWLIVTFIGIAFGALSPTERQAGDAPVAVTVAIILGWGLLVSLGQLRMSWWSALLSLGSSAMFIVALSRDQDLSGGARVIVIVLCGSPFLLTAIGAARHWRRMTWNPLGRTLRPVANPAETFA